MENARVLSFRSRLKSAQEALEGFPWKLATILYTLSWGWSLLRPNTLYWDDWAYIYNKPKSYLNQIFVDTGLPPWRALIDQELIAVGYWTIPVLTFLLFFASGIALYLILKKVIFLNQTQINLTILIFLIAPVNHARISLTMFGYTTSFFLFFAAWAILIRHSKTWGFLLAAILFFWGFMTHSFLFFLVLPIVHYIFLNRHHLDRAQRDLKLIWKTSILLLLPITYVALRHRFWQPTEQFQHYHDIYNKGILLGLIYFLPFTLLAGLLLISYKNRTARTYRLALGFFALGLGVFPYCISNNADRSLFLIWKAEWTSRHQLLMPLGLAILIVTMCSFLKIFKLQHLMIFCCFSFVGSNTFLGAQYFLDSLKKDQLTELFRQTEIVESSSDLIFVDDTKLFNGRFSTYRDTEILGLLDLADKSVKSITGNSTCDDIEVGYEIRLKSEKSFSSALLSRKLGLYFEIKEC